MRQRIILAALLLVLCGAFVLAQETALRATVSYNADGTATINEVSVTIAGIDQQSDRPLPHGVRLVIDDSLVYTLPAPITFRLLDAYAPMSAYTTTFRLPYFGNRGTLNVIRDNNVVASFDLRQLCDNDGSCGKFENGISCPDDCEIGTTDNVCLPFADNACDPDCGPGLDLDCGTAPPSTTPATPQPERPVRIEPATLPVYLLLGFALVIAFIYIWTKNK
jgi:hypothetical protein